MAEIEIQRKEGGVPAWAWIVGALLLAALIWWMVAANTGERREAGVDTTAPPAAGMTTDTSAQTSAGTGVAGKGMETMTPNVEAANANLPLAAIQQNPDAYFNKWVSGMGTVTEVLSDRAFRIEQDGQQMLVVKAENIVETTNIVQGSQVSFSGMVVNPATAADRVPSMDRLEEGTRQRLQSAKAFIHATNIEMQNSETGR